MTNAAATAPSGQPDWQAFQDGLMAASLAGVPIALDGQAPAASPSALLASLSEWRQQNEDQWPRRYHAARAVYEHTGDMPLVLDGLTAISRSGQQLARLVWKPWRYLVLLTGVACLGLLGYWALVVPDLKRLRSDLDLVPLPIAEARPAVFFPGSDFGVLDSIPWIVVGLVGLMFVGTLVLWATKGLTTLMSRGGQSGYLRQNAVAIGGRVAAQLLQRGSDLDTAISISSDLVVGSQTLVQPIRDAASAAALNQAVRPDGGSLDSCDPTVAALRRATQHFDLAARTRLSLLQNLLPLLVVTLIGGGGALLYCLTLFLPLIRLLDDTAQPVHLVPTPQHSVSAADAVTLREPFVDQKVAP